MTIKHKLLALFLIFILLLSGCAPASEDSSSSPLPPEASSEESIEEEESTEPEDPLPAERLYGFWVRLDPKQDDYPLFFNISDDAMTVWIDGYTLEAIWECNEPQEGKAVLQKKEDAAKICELSFKFREEELPAITITGLKDYPDLVFYQGYTIMLTSSNWDKYFTYTYQLEPIYNSQGTLLGINLATFYQLEPVYEESLLVLHATYQVYYQDVPVRLEYPVVSGTPVFTLMNDEEDPEAEDQDDESAEDIEENDEDEDEDSLDESEPSYYNGVSLINSSNMILTEDHWGQTIWINEENTVDDLLTEELILRLPSEVVHVQGYLVLTVPVSALDEKSHQLIPFPAMPEVR